jgi:ribosomal protein S6 kinase alpha-5
LEQIKDLPFLATIRYAFQTPDKLYLILDFVQGGELFTQLKNEGTLSVDKTRFYIAQIILALEQLHKLNISYRDIKLENIMLDADGNIVLVDFGLAKILVDDERTNSYCGTLDYMVNLNFLLKSTIRMLKLKFILL